MTSMRNFRNIPTTSKEKISFFLGDADDVRCLRLDASFLIRCWSLSLSLSWCCPAFFWFYRRVHLLLDCGDFTPFLAVVVWYVAIKTKPLSEKLQKHWISSIIMHEKPIGLVIQSFARRIPRRKNLAKFTAIYKTTPQTSNWPVILEPLLSSNHHRHDCSYCVVRLDPLGDSSLEIGNLVAFIEYSFHALLFPILSQSLYHVSTGQLSSSHRLKETGHADFYRSQTKWGYRDRNQGLSWASDNVTFRLSWWDRESSSS